jgi:GAF domain-containing protein
MNSYYDVKNQTAKVRVSELHMATADYTDDTIDKAVSDTLQQLRKDLDVDVVFVSEFLNGKRIFRYVDAPSNVIEEGGGDSLEDSWCKFMVDGQLPQYLPDAKKYLANGTLKLPELPFDVGTYLSTPILVNNNEVYGTLCCFSFAPNPEVQEKDLKSLKAVASLVSQKIEKNHKTSDAPINFRA